MPLSLATLAADILDGGGGEATITALETVVKNLADHPQNRKYRTLRLSNPMVAERLLACTAASQFLSELGFVEADGFLALATPLNDNEARSALAALRTARVRARRRARGAASPASASSRSLATHSDAGADARTAPPRGGEGSQCDSDLEQDTLEGSAGGSLGDFVDPTATDALVRPGTAMGSGGLRDEISSMAGLIRPSTALVQWQVVDDVDDDDRDSERQFEDGDGDGDANVLVVHGDSDSDDDAGSAELHAAGGEDGASALSLSLSRGSQAEDDLSVSIMDAGGMHSEHTTSGRGRPALTPAATAARESWGAEPDVKPDPSATPAMSRREAWNTGESGYATKFEGDERAEIVAALGSAPATSEARRVTRQKCGWDSMCGLADLKLELQGIADEDEGGPRWSDRTLLLYGPPGCGKMLAVRLIVGRAAGCGAHPLSGLCLSPVCMCACVSCTQRNVLLCSLLCALKPPTLRNCAKKLRSRIGSGLLQTRCLAASWGTGRLVTAYGAELCSQFAKREARYAAARRIYERAAALAPCVLLLKALDPILHEVEWVCGSIGCTNRINCICGGQSVFAYN